MANAKISALPAASALDGTEKVPLVQGGTTKRATVTEILAVSGVESAWIVDIDCMMPMIDEPQGANRSVPGGYLYGLLASWGVDGDEYGWDIVLGAGTYTLTLCHEMNTSTTIYTFRIDGVDVGTIDGHAGSTIPNSYSTITGIVISSGGKKRLSVVGTPRLQHLQLRRTA